MSLLNSAPAVGFDQPYEMLEACHERVERSLRLLLRLAEHLRRQGVDAQARDAARDLLRYFDIAAPHHHEDEERHVLPRLRALGRAALADRIAAEHVQMDAAYQALRPALLALRDAGLRPDAAALAGWPGFAALYRAHIALEEGDAYPASRAATAADSAESTDSTDWLARMGAEMAARRRAPPSLP